MRRNRLSTFISTWHISEYNKGRFCGWCLQHLFTVSLLLVIPQLHRNPIEDFTGGWPCQEEKQRGHPASCKIRQFSFRRPRDLGANVS